MRRRARRRGRMAAMIAKKGEVSEERCCVREDRDRTVCRRVVGGKVEGSTATPVQVRALNSEIAVYATYENMNCLRAKFVQENFTL